MGQFKTGKFQFPQYIAKHGDKVVSECIFEEPEEE
jgi:hypothetical protein